MPRPLTESTTATPQALTGHRYRVRVIEGPRWGTSGYYGPAALDSAAQVLTPGTKVFLDHPSTSEARDRPERSLRDLAAKIDGPITREADGVYAVMNVLPHWRDVVASLAADGDLDMSIRALAEFHPGEAEGRHGPIIDEFVDFPSVDLVTEAGAGGRVLELIESARKPAVEATANDRRDQLRAALAAAYAPGDDDYLWVRDFDDARGLAWFEQGDQIWQQSYTANDTTVTLTGTPVEVRVITTYQPIVGPVDTQPQEAHMPTIDEAEYKRLTEAATNLPQLTAELAEAKQAIDKVNAEKDAAVAEAAEARAEKANALIDAAALPDPAKARLREAIKATPDADVAALITAEADYLAKVAPVRPGVFGGSGDSEPAPTRTRNPWGRDLTQKGA